MSRLGNRTGFELYGCFDHVRTSRRTRVYGSSVDHYWAFQCKPRIRHWGPVMGGHNAPLGSAERLLAAPNESVPKRSSARRVVRRCTTASPAAFYRGRSPCYDGPLAGAACTMGLVCVRREKSLWGPIRSASRAY